MVNDVIETLVSPNNSLNTSPELGSVILRDSSTSVTSTNTNRPTSSGLHIIKEDSSNTDDSKQNESVPLSELSSLQQENPSLNNESTQVSQPDSEDIPIFGYLQKYFEEECDESYPAMNDACTSLASNKQSSLFLRDESEVLLKLIEPGSKCFVSDCSIENCNLVYMDNTSEDNPLNRSKNKSTRNQKSLPIPIVTPTQVEPYNNIERLPGVQTPSPSVLPTTKENIITTCLSRIHHNDDNCNRETTNDSYPEVEHQIQESSFNNKITIPMISSHSNTEHKEECQKPQPTITNKQENATNDNILTIQVQDKDSQNSQQITASIFKLKKNSNNYAKFTISFQFLKDQGTQHFSKASCAGKDRYATHSETFSEIAIQSVDLNVAASKNENTPISLITKLSVQEQNSSNVPFIILNSPMSSKFSHLAVTTQPTFRTFTSIPSLISPISVLTTLPNQPKTLFLQALTKLNESSINVAVFNNPVIEHAATSASITNALIPLPNTKLETTLSELSPPDSLTCAPPSYSFVLRQSARRRPRLMGNFIPSPSFVHKTPPPTYAAAFDIYVDSPLPPPTNRVYNYGFTEMPVVCPQCGYAGVTFIISKITLCTHLCALLLCLFCCWFCAPLPYVMRSCKDVYHYCRNCRNLLGIYRPYNPQSPYITHQ